MAWRRVVAETGSSCIRTSGACAGSCAAATRGGRVRAASVLNFITDLCSTALGFVAAVVLGASATIGLRPGAELQMLVAGLAAVGALALLVEFVMRRSHNGKHFLLCRLAVESVYPICPDTVTLRTRVLIDCRKVRFFVIDTMDHAHATISSISMNEPATPPYVCVPPDPSKVSVPATFRPSRIRNVVLTVSCALPK